MYKSEDKIINISTEEYLRLYRDADRFVAFCKKCQHYGNCWSCPPFTFDVDKHISGYKHALIIGTKITSIDNLNIRDVFSRERKRLDALLLTMEERYPRSKSFFAGVCVLCDDTKCSRINGEPCRHTNAVRPSLEAFGFDIERTAAELLGIEIKWGSKGEAPEYLTLVSGFFTNDDIII